MIKMLADKNILLNAADLSTLIDQNPHEKLKTALTEAYKQTNEANYQPISRSWCAKFCGSSTPKQPPIILANVAAEYTPTLQASLMQNQC